jgi:hypothetical protein
MLKGGENVAGKLVNRKPLNTTIDIKISDTFDLLSKDTRIAKSKLVDEALTDLFKKYGYEIKE